MTSDQVACSGFIAIAFIMWLSIATITPRQQAYEVKWRVLGILTAVIGAGALATAWVSP